jgi:hypothetical protein
MRCPQCSKRNSVAATKCGDCGHLFKRKPIPFQVKFFLGFFAALVLLWGVASALVPQLGEPQAVLTRTAKALASGPKSQQEANKLSGDFDHALQECLKKFSNLTDIELSKKLRADLPASVFEVHIFDLSRAMRLVEIDDVLRPTDYLLSTNANKSTVLPIQGLEVYDDGTLIKESSGNYLVLLGHTGGQSSHKPTVKVFSISTGDLIDVSDKAVPPLVGEGTVAFDHNKKDLYARISLLSVGQAESLFNSKQLERMPIDDETVHYFLAWNNGHYGLTTNRGNGPLSALYCVAKCLKEPGTIANYATTINAKAKKTLQQQALPPGKDPNFTILPPNDSAKKPLGAKTFLLSNSDLIVKVDLDRPAPSGNHPRVWLVSNLEINNQTGSKPDDKLAMQTPTVEPIAESSSQTPNQEDSSSPGSEKSAGHKGSDRSATATSEEKQVEPSSDQSKDNTTKSQASKTEDTESSQAESTGQNQSAAPSTSSTETSSENTGEATTSSDGPARVLTNTADSIQLRKGPSTQSGSLAEIKKGTEVQILGREQSWYKVRADGKEGFVYAGLIDYKKPDAYTVATVKKSKSVTDKQNRSLGTPQIGDRLVILQGIKNDKYQVQLANGKVGFVDKDAIDVAVDAPPSVP